MIGCSILVMAKPKGFERLFLKTAGGVIGGVSDHLGAWIDGSVIVGVVGWTVIGVACLWQARRQKHSSD